MLPIPAPGVMRKSSGRTEPACPSVTRFDAIVLFSDVRLLPA